MIGVNWSSENKKFWRKLLTKVGLAGLIFASAFLFLSGPVLGQYYNLGAFWQNLVSSFSISGVTGGTDVTVDAYLSNGLNPTIHFTPMQGATSYDVVIKNAADTATQCQVLGATVAPVSLTSCGLATSTTYKVHITATTGAGTKLAANDGFSFSVGALSMSLEVPIQMITGSIQNIGTTAVILEDSRSSLDTAAYDGTLTYSFEAYVTNNDTSARSVYLVNNAGTTLATLPATASTSSRYRTTFTPTVGADTYRVKIDGTPSSSIVVYAARIIVKQVGASKTKIFIPLTSIPNSSGNTIASTTTTQGNAAYYSIWKKDSSAWSAVAAGSPWTFEAVFQSSASSKTAYIEFANFSTTTILATVSSTATVPTLLSTSFADNLTGFNNLDLYQVQGRISSTAGSNFTTLFKAGIWVTLTSLTQAEIFYYGTGQHRALLDLSLFSNPFVHAESTAYITSGATGCTTEIGDLGTSDTSNSYSTVANSSLSFTSTAKTLARTASAFSITSGNRFWGSYSCTTSTMTNVSNFEVIKSSALAVSGPGSFSITGITGGTDATQDTWLSNGLNPAVNFTSSSGAISYDVIIKDAAGTTTLCSSLAQSASPVSPSSCGLSNGGTYKVYVTAKLGTASTTAFNNGYSFTIDNTAPVANTITGITGASDSVVDAWLAPGLVPTVNWNAFTGAASYDVTIKNAAGTVTVCATQNSLTLSYNFSSCNLVDATSYKAYVTAKSPSGIFTTNASNTGFSFSVDNVVPGAFTIGGITGGTDILQDAYLSNGTSPTVNYGASTNVYKYDILIKNSTDTTLICSALDQVGSPTAVASCGLTNGSTYVAHVTAKSISGLNTTAATNDAFSFFLGAPPAGPPADFEITGATGGSDSTADNWLTSGVNVTANWQAAAGAANYDVTIRDSADAVTVCATQNTTAAFFNFSTCTLVVGTTYKIKVTAYNSVGLSTAALNTAFPFKVTAPAPGPFSILGAKGGADTVADDYLMNGTTVTADWNTSSGATSYDVTIRNAGDTADVCALQNLAAATWTFTGCALSAATTYTIRVVAKLGTQTTEAYNSPFSFYVPAVLNTCTTGNVYAAKALVIQSTLWPATPGYNNSESCNYTISPPATATSILLTFATFASNGTTDIMNVYDATSATNLLGGPYKSNAAPPATLTAVSGNMFITWVSSNSGNSSAGYNLNYKSTYAAAGSFTITGVSGGSDSTADTILTDNSSGLTVAWGASAAASGYDVIVKDGMNATEVCTKGSTTSTSLNLAGCNNLIEGATYVVNVFSKNSNGLPVAASNNPFSFTYQSSPIDFVITGATGGTDSIADNYLESGTAATINWQASSNQTSYDVTIVESDGFTVRCAKVNVPSGSLNYNFSTCPLTLGATYKADVVAKNAAGNTPATNNYFSFSLITPWSPTSLVSAPTARAGSSAVWTGSEMIIWGGQDGNYTFFQSGGKYNPSTDSWVATSTGTNAPSARSYHTAVWTGSEMIIWAGYLEGGIYTNSGGKYNPSSNSWALSTLSLVSERTGHTTVWTGSQMIVWGGKSSDFFLDLSTGIKYDPAADSWTATSTGANLPSARADHTAIWTGTQMIIWGGGLYNMSTGGKYTPGTDTWVATSTGANTPSARRRHTAVWTGSEMIIWGGDTGSNAIDGGKYTPGTDTWVATSTGANVPSARYYHTAVWTGTEMIIWGGYSIGATNTGGKYNPSTDTWAASNLSLGQVREYHTAIWTGSEMIVWGGGTNTGGKYTPGTDSWVGTSTGANVPEARTDHRAVWTGTEMIIWGGSGYTSGGKYNPSTNTWGTISQTNKPSGANGISAVWTGTEMIIWGGYGAGNTGGRYTPGTDTWVATSTGANVPSARSNFTSIWTGTEMIIWGGSIDSGLTNTGGKYNPSTDAWVATSTGTNVPSARYSHTAVWTGTEMIIWGGYSGSGGTNTGGKYNPSTDAWVATSTGANVPSARYYHTAVWTGTQMIIWGGYDGTYLNTGAKYTPGTDTWIATGTGANVPSARRNHSAIWTGTQMIIFGGGSSGGTNTGGKYTPGTDVWAAMSTGAPANSPSASWAHTAIWTGTEMIIWGGYQQSSTTNTGGKYTPGTDSWSVTSTGVNVPAARYYHTAVWTGTEMIIWGGYSGSGGTNTGGKYTPGTDSWSVTSTGANVPSARYKHTAVWTGTQMIIWGGQLGNSGAFNTGGKYTPGTDAWLATSTGANVPSARYYHKAVWTGTQMIIWGGYNGTYLNTGGKYTPGTDAWLATSTGANVPEARTGHTAVWTGTEMIILGGYKPSNYLYSGGKYNPGADSWTVTSTGANVPAIRGYHTAVWTGTEMIIWGGNSPGIGSMYNSGGKYSPSTDSWVATSTGTNVPSRRALHEAQWTGTEMIVWGGYENTSYFNTGGKYNPGADTWVATPVSSGTPSIRRAPLSVWTGTQMIIWGGTNGSTNYNTGGVYNP